MKKILLLFSLIIFTACGNQDNLITSEVSIVSLSPPVTEVLIDLGLSDYIIGVDMFSAGIEGLAEGIAVFDLIFPDMEALILADPSLIFTSIWESTDPNNPFAEVLRSSMVYIPTANSFSEIVRQIAYIGEITGTSEAALAITEEFEERVNALAAASERTPVYVYFEIDIMPDLFTFGSGVFLNDVLEMLGATNIFRDLEGWAAVSAEQVIYANPDIILTNINFLDDPIGEIINRPGFAAIDAVRNGKVFYIDTDSSSRANHNIIYAIEQIAEKLEAVN